MMIDFFFRFCIVLLLAILAVRWFWYFVFLILSTKKPERFEQILSEYGLSIEGEEQRHRGTMYLSGYVIFLILIHFLF